MTTMKTTSTREQIIELLKRREQMTVSAIAAELNITEMAVRRHLNTLERDHVVVTTLQRQAMGRPTNVYELSNEGQELFPRSYGELSIELLKIIQETDGMTKIEELFERRKDRLKRTYEKRMFMKGFDERVKELAAIQSELGYMAEVCEDETGGYLLKEFNCPIAEVAREFPVICEAQKSLFKDLLETDGVTCELCMATGQGDHCYYKIVNSQAHN
ncbi:helix-turn-helix transcriptional regulator [Salisediminibacterium halotolerans]|uniref:helix-turn-helix transcriptional regulator n=1 Tax=Salisediminibacterium halotolerans TaxID=517425 RepID=UPI000EAFC65D|nr:winged helix-turn-helix transcriptional regulator [Salisediminibacterium halotolerans]RLJ75392.1 putative ArsR family transcriptional regulator [Actinophytocola xinjiangensis]RPE89246.1 putative ArsR family transcriptional regulator [Salisediminibacterium halotolerans]TWG36005.1 putative ArsR family transcriptional regulator [Salisediminibacterium halotolerans]GEL07798.1 DeoR family transcriptional regulator [Salisediminibacterium halotolerans]